MALSDAKPRVVTWAVTPIRVTLAGSVSAGDLIGLSASGWVQAVASATAPIAARLVAMEVGASADVIQATPMAVVESYTGGTAGAQLFLSDTAGLVEEAVTGSLYQKVGFMASSTVGFLMPALSQEQGLMNVARSTDDTRALYARLYQATAAGSGDAIRGYQTILAGIAAANAHGIHGSVSFNAGGSVTGLAAGIRATLDFAANTASPSGTYTALQVDSNVGAGITLPATTSFIRVADNGAVKLPFLLDLSSLTSGASNAWVTGEHAGTTVGGVIRINTVAGAMFIKCYSD